MALSQTSYARGAHLARDESVSVPPWHDQRSSQFGIRPSTPETLPSAEAEATRPARATAPMLRGTAAELRSRREMDNPVMRRPHLRGTLMRQNAMHDAPQEGEWSATADPSPAPTEQAQQEAIMNSPTAGVQLSKLMLEIGRQYDLDVEETVRRGW